MKMHTELRSTFLACLLLVTPVGGYGASISKASCVAADQVRLSLHGVQYRIPSELQPNFTPPEAVRTVDVFPDGVRRKQYCQSEADPPPVVQRISFPKEPLAAWALRDVRYARLADVNPLAIHQPPAAVAFRVPDGGEITKDGLFRQIVRGSRSELASLDRLFFGAQVTANCGPAGTQYPSDSCDIWTRLPDGALVRLGVLTARQPRENWPAMLKQVEAFITTLTTDGNHRN
jgi:hypothetical protein